MNFRQYLNESKEMLDISIQAAGKYLTNDKKIEEFLTSEVTVEHKTDGVKITAIKTENDWIIAYKGNVLYSSEFNYQPKTKIKGESIGASQFKLVLEHFEKFKNANIPNNTELFVEFLMNKPTLSSNYTKKHKMVLIGHTKSSYTEKFGKLKTKPSGFDISKRDVYAKELKLDTPALLFKGILGSQITFESGIIDKVLNSEFQKAKTSMTWDNPKLLVDDIRSLFLSIESKYGGLEEGVVIKYNDKILKFQQEYQLDQAARFAIKQKYREDSPEAETQYWNNVTGAAEGIARTIVVKSRKLPEILEELALIMKKITLNFEHSKKTPAMIKDDIQLTSKNLLIKQMRGNNNALILGKFRVLTEAGHAKMIRKAQKLYDNVVICLVTSKDTKDTKDLREEMIRKTFPDVEIIHSTNGNLTRILQKSPININIVYAGSDRVRSYQDQLKNTLGTDVREMPRTDDDISASKIIANIEDEEFFKKNTPKAIHSLYNKIKGIYNG